MRITVRPNGAVEAIYEDALLPVFAALGRTPIVMRASFVEPVAGGWMVDLRPSLGPVLGLSGEVASVSQCPLPMLATCGFKFTPFPTRQAALDAEREWLTVHLGL